MAESLPPLGFHQPRAEVLLLCSVSHMPHSFLTCCSFSLRMLLVSSENIAVTVIIAQCAYTPIRPISSSWSLRCCPDPPFLKQFCPPTFLSPFRMLSAPEGSVVSQGNRHPPSRHSIHVGIHAQTVMRFGLQLKFLPSPLLSLLLLSHHHPHHHYHYDDDGDDDNNYDEPEFMNNVCSTSDGTGEN